MGRHDAEYFREYRARRRSQPRLEVTDDFPQEVYERGKELAMLIAVPKLDWPEALFAGVALDKPRVSATYVDPMKCPCGKPHKNAVSKVVGQRPNWRVEWYCNSAHKMQYAKGA